MDDEHARSASGPADFIEVFEDALDAATCRAIVERMRGSDRLVPGAVGSGVMPELKHSRDLRIAGLPDWADVEQRIQQAVFGARLACAATRRR